MPGAKTVAIVGAGPSGLVTAKTLLRSHPSGTFAPVIFEKADRLGGLWPDERHGRGLVQPNMPTNLSRFLVSFSDLAWESVDLRSASGHRSDGFVPVFPKAWQVNRYLLEYSKRYLPQDLIRLNSRVVRTKREVSEGRQGWLVEWEHTSADGKRGRTTRSERFDFLVVASGFFSAPFVPDLPGLKDFPALISHSSRVVDLDCFGAGQRHPHAPNLKEDTAPDERKVVVDQGKIVVVGGSLSGAEAATILARQQSSALYSPSTATARPRRHILHVTSRAFWALPSLLPADPLVDGESNPAPTFLPLDVCMYDVAKLAPGPVQIASAILNKDTSRTFNAYFQTLAGGDQSDLADGQLRINRNDAERPPYVTISDGYSAFLLARDVEPVRGSLRSIGRDKAGNGRIVYASADAKEHQIDGVALLVLATGFTPNVALDYLPRDVLELLDYDESCLRWPLVLQNGSTLHSGLPNLGFVGFYQGPFWGVMEMQARLLGKLWADIPVTPSDADARTDLKSAQQLRQAIHLSGPVSQFTMGDYTGLMETLGARMRIPRTPLPGMTEGEGPVAPARYLDHGCDREEAAKTLSSIQQMCTQATQETRLIGRPVFSALQGPWRVARDLYSALPTFPSGRFVGKAAFHPREPTDVGYDAEYLYIEDGDFKPSNGPGVAATRRYVYRYRQDTDGISVWFVKSGDGSTVDFHFHDLKFDRHSVEGSANYAKAWVAQSDHLCVEDRYKVKYTVKFRGVAIDGVEVSYDVNGPRKEYTINTDYRRVTEN
ncbi:MAG: hypothetical protein M1833_002793 [Piccolia ochrophora]|nr:MAG: hypothetical protein M1833_002793 [Piccolia ochrophora]